MAVNLKPVLREPEPLVLSSKCGLKQSPSYYTASVTAGKQPLP